MNKADLSGRTQHFNVYFNQAKEDVPFKESRTKEEFTILSVRYIRYMIHVLFLSPSSLLMSHLVPLLLLPLTAPGFLSFPPPLLPVDLLHLALS